LPFIEAIRLCPRHVFRNSSSSRSILFNSSISNNASGEGLARQRLYGVRWFKHEFGDLPYYQVVKEPHFPNKYPDGARPYQVEAYKKMGAE